MKTQKLLPLLLLIILFTSCVKKITRVVHQDPIAPEFSVEKETLKSRISAVIPAQSVSFSSSKTEINGGAETNSLSVEIVSDTLPSNLVSFFRLTDELREAVESGIGNMEKYQKLEIVVRHTFIENSVKHAQSYKKEIDL